MTQCSVCACRRAAQNPLLRRRLATKNGFQDGQTAIAKKIELSQSLVKVEQVGEKPEAEEHARIQ
jgi:hypothetical protein